MDYVPRILDAELGELLAGISGIAIDGPKGVGKTETALRFTDVVYRLDVPDDARRFKADPREATSDPTARVLIDEWQGWPASWDYVRRAIDADSTPGRFLLTGSASTDQNTHSGAGRIVRVRMRPLTLAERGITPAVSLAEIINGEAPAPYTSTEIGLHDYVSYIVRGGFPGMQGASDRVLRAQLDGYLARILDRDIPEAGIDVRRPATFRRWLNAYAAASSTDMTWEKIRDAASGGEGNHKPHKATAAAYREALERIWILDPVPAWSPSENVIKRLTGAPKHNLVDPALAARALDLTEESLLAGNSARGGRASMLGPLFESLLALNLRVYAQAAEASVHHLRIAKGTRKIDFILQRPDGRVVAVEVKLAGAPTDDHLKHLRWLRGQIGDRLVDTVLITTGRYAYRTEDDSLVVPAALLGP